MRDGKRTVRRAILSVPGGNRLLSLVRRWQGLAVRFFFVRPVPTVVLLTAANSPYARSLLQFLESIALHETGARVIVFDLGLRAEEREEIARRFPFAELRRLAFERYPPFFDIRVAAGEYAWKPIIIADVLDELGEPVCWMDAGNLLTTSTRRLRQVVAARGFYSPLSAGTIKDWTHPGTLRYLGAGPKLLHKRNLNAACVAVNPAFQPAVDLIHRWRDCAYVHECIAPSGSNRANHRQDQAVLSVLAHQTSLVSGKAKDRWRSVMDRTL